MKDFMTKRDLVLEVLAQHGTEYRFVRHRWWRLVSGYWTQDSARESLIRAFHEIRAKIPETSDQNRRLKTWGGMSYGYGWIITRVKEQLTDDALPARTEPPRHQHREYMD